MKYSAYCILILSVVIALALASIFLDVERVWADSVIANIGVGPRPAGITYGNGKLYVTHDLPHDTTPSSYVSVIDGSTNRVVTNVSIGPDLVGITYDSTNGEIYVPNCENGFSSVSVIDGSTNRVNRNIPVGEAPAFVTFDSGNDNIYVVNGGRSTISVIDGSTNTAVGNPISFSQSIAGIAYNPENDKLYLAVRGSDYVSVIDGSTNTVVGNPIPVGSNPFAIAYNPDNANMYVTNVYSDFVSVIGTRTVQPPLRTTITSATDGNSKPVQSGGSTFSTSITFRVIATQGSNPIAGFECSLDASSFSTCGSNTNPSTVRYNNLAAGQQHTFKVRVVDTTGNKDPPPAIFSWTIVTPKQAVQNIINTINNMHLSKGITTSLEAPLNAALSQLNHNNGAAACNTLNAFLQQVNAKGDNRQLTSQQAADLRQQAITVETNLGCSSTTTTTTATTNNEGSKPAPSEIEQSQEQNMINLRKMTENNTLLSSLNEIAKQGK